MHRHRFGVIILRTCLEVISESENEVVSLGGDFDHGKLMRPVVFGVIVRNWGVFPLPLGVFLWSMGTYWVPTTNIPNGGLCGEFPPQSPYFRVGEIFTQTNMELASSGVLEDHLPLKWALL